MVTANVLLLPSNESMAGGEEEVEGVAEQAVRVERGGACLAHCPQHACMPVCRGDRTQHLHKYVLIFCKNINILIYLALATSSSHRLELGVDGRPLFDVPTLHVHLTTGEVEHILHTFGDSHFPFKVEVSYLYCKRKWRVEESLRLQLRNRDGDAEAGDQGGVKDRLGRSSKRSPPACSCLNSYARFTTNVLWGALPSFHEAFCGKGKFWRQEKDQERGEGGDHAVQGVGVQ